jgi:hypothetical protein
MYVSPHAELVVEGVLRLEQDSELHFSEESGFRVQKGSKAILMHKSRIYLDNKVKLDMDGRIKIRDGCIVYCASAEALEKVRKATWQKKRVQLSPGQLNVESTP